jgi:hypothetical protein
MRIFNTFPHINEFVVQCLTAGRFCVVNCCPGGTFSTQSQSRWCMLQQSMYFMCSGFIKVLWCSVSSERERTAEKVHNDRHLRGWWTSTDCPGVRMEMCLPTAPSFTQSRTGHLNFFANLLTVDRSGLFLQSDISLNIAAPVTTLPLW